ncbi:MAG: hypothetical protein VX074_00550 [Bacteroidota bacterium]|nr:hypothetical protein [Bacteroidota bacterium]
MIEQLSKINHHNNDDKISFDEDTHTYFVNGEKVNFSVTEIVEKFFPKFDSEYWSNYKAKEKLNHLKFYDEDTLQKTKSEILLEWDNKRKISSEKGSLLHKQIENYYNKAESKIDVEEFKYFLDFLKTYPKLKPYRTEWQIYDSSLSLAGTIDMVYKKNNGELFLFDWKRSKKILDVNGKILSNHYEYGLEDLSHIGASSFNKYCLQLNIYRKILENNYDKKISSMNILVLHSKYDTYCHLKVPKMEEEALFLIKNAQLKK